MVGLRRVYVPVALMSFASLAAAAGGSWARPTEVAILPSGEGVVMVADGRLVAFDTRAPRPAWRQIYRINDLSLRPVAVELALVEGEATALVLLYRDARQSYLARVGLQSGPRPPVQALPVGRGPAGGLAVRPGATDALLLSVSDRGVYKLDAGVDSPQPEFQFSLPARMRPGGIAWRRQRPEIVITDLDSPSLHLARWPDGQHSTVRGVAGLIRSVALDPSGRYAYLAEARRGVVWRVDLTDSGASPREVVPRGSIRELSDLAVGGDGRVWIVDEAGAALFVVDAGGGALRRVFQW
jgi:hypothetical protein